MNSFARKYWLAIVVIILSLIAVFLAIVYQKPINQWGAIFDAVVVATGWVLFFVQYFYSKSEKFYMWVNSLRLWITNEATKWNFVVNFTDCKQEYPLKKIWEVITKQKLVASQWHHDSSSLIINMSGYTLRAFTSNGALYDSELSGSEVISIQISNLELPFRNFKAKIENEAIPLIKDIARTLQPTKEKYSVKIAFSSKNPYFGFFIRRLDLPSVISFTCDFIESSIGGHDQTVTICKDRIEIVTDDLLTLQVLSMKYVRLASN